VEVRGIRFDSRQVQPGDLFVAVPGERRDGHEFIPDALARGASALVVEREPDEPGAAAVVRVESARRALGDFSAAFYEHPSHHLKLIGVTGTDGKSSTTRLCAELLEAAGLRTGWLTTVEIKIGDQPRPNDFNHTTPEAPYVQATLAEMLDAGLECAVLEVSSHALALERVRGCEFDVAVFTNLSPEHLNFHGSLEAYLEAKCRLFRRPGLSLAVLNADDPHSEAIAAVAAAPVDWYGVEPDREDAVPGGTGDFTPDYLAADLDLAEDGTRFTLIAPFASAGMRLSTRLVGRFNVANWLAAIAATVPLGVDAQAVRLAAQRAAPVRGRMEEIRAGQPFRVIVDFSHTPQALETALGALRPLTQGRLIVVFGQAGERDPSNRPRMGQIASEKADYFIISTDDPLFEDPAEIARQIAMGAASRNRQLDVHFAIELNRREAIRMACGMARPGDTVLLAGKGHERRMLVQDRREPWSDQEVAREVLAELRQAGRVL
jgi:UDP-N-acetylmuramoyl-L-alanyl-D-glutamate--2,6-diaminopimelate ligase